MEESNGHGSLVEMVEGVKVYSYFQNECHFFYALHKGVTGSRGTRVIAPFILNLDSRWK